MMDRRAFMATGVAAGIAATGARAHTSSPADDGPVPAQVADPDEVIHMWPDGSLARQGPPLIETVIERSADPCCPDRAAFGISAPQIAVFRPRQPNGRAVLVTPGGGYRWVVVDKEGYELGHWLSARGFTVFVLFYRLPADGWAEGPNAPLADAQRAMRLIRQRSSDYGVDPSRVAAAGFSAGGHVCADLAARFAERVRAPVDAADLLSARPDAAAPIYPVVSMDAAIAHEGSRRLLLGPTPSAELERAHSVDHNVPADAPPHFLLHAEDDAAVPVANSLRLRDALRNRGIAVDTHLFATGGHGFGLRRAAGHPVAIWPNLLHGWLDAQLAS